MKHRTKCTWEWSLTLVLAQLVNCKDVRRRWGEGAMGRQGGALYCFVWLGVIFLHVTGVWKCISLLIPECSNAYLAQQLNWFLASFDPVRDFPGAHTPTSQLSPLLNNCKTSVDLHSSVMHGAPTVIIVHDWWVKLAYAGQFCLHISSQGN